MVAWFSKNSVYQPFGNRNECCFTEGRRHCFQLVVFTLCTVLTGGESSVKCMKWSYNNLFLELTSQHTFYHVDIFLFASLCGHTHIYACCIQAQAWRLALCECMYTTYAYLHPSCPFQLSISPKTDVTTAFWPKENFTKALSLTFIPQASTSSCRLVVYHQYLGNLFSICQ